MVDDQWRADLDKHIADARQAADVDAKSALDAILGYLGTFDEEEDSDVIGDTLFPDGMEDVVAAIPQSHYAPAVHHPELAPHVSLLPELQLPELRPV